MRWEILTHEEFHKLATPKGGEASNKEWRKQWLA